MTQILTPKDIVGILLDTDDKPPAFKPWNNAVQKWLFLSAVSAFVVGALLAAGVKFQLSAEARAWGALGALTISQVAAALYQLAVVVPAVKTFGNPVKTIAEPAAEHFDADIQAISHLAKTFDQHHLDYARDRLAQIIDQRKFRIGFFIGSIEKVGIFPSAIAGYIYAKDILEKPEFKSSGIEWVFAGLVAFYIIAAVFMTASQRVERLALVARHAATKKLNDCKS